VGGRRSRPDVGAEGRPLDVLAAESDVDVVLAGHRSQIDDRVGTIPIIGSLGERRVLFALRFLYRYNVDRK